VQETKLSDTSGTLNFMAPEQLGKSTYKGKPADVWSCGCILFMLLSGRLPFEGPNRNIVQTKIRGAMLAFEPADVWQQVSDSAKDLIRKMVRRFALSRSIALSLPTHVNPCGPSCPRPCC